MDRPGEKLKRVRERLKLTYRDVEQASQVIARRRGNEDFAVPLSRLADVENKGTLPSIFRLYTLCAIYRLDLDEVLGWYGVPPDMLAADSFQLQHGATHLVQFPRAADRSSSQEAVASQDAAEVAAELDRTVFIGHPGRHFEKIPLDFLAGSDTRHLRYGLIGLADWSMYPLLLPGSLVVIDDSRRKIAAGGWTNEHERPIYFLEHRGGHACGWCAITGSLLVVQPHPACNQVPQVFAFPSEVDVLGEVVGVAMRLGPRLALPRQNARAAAPATSPGR